MACRSVVLLILSMGVNVFLLVHSNQNTSPGSQVTKHDHATDPYGAPYAQLGVMDRAKDQQAKQSLQKFLEDKSKNSCKNLTPDGYSYEWVDLASDDQTQVRIKYGCNHPDSNATAVYKDGKWQMTDITNQWDMIGNPSCALVNKYSIAKELAPVCFTDDGAKGFYTVR